MLISKALCLLSSHSISIFLTLINKVGIDALLDCLSSNNGQVQQAILTMIAMLVNESGLKGIPEKVHLFRKIFIQSIVILLLFFSQ